MKSFRFRREILNQLPPIREILSDYQLNLMASAKIHPSQTNAIQCSVLCPRIIRRHTYCVSRGARSCTPVFHPQQWNIPRHIVCRQATFLIEMVIYLFFWKKVWYYNKMNETLRTWEANSHLPSRCPPHLGTNGQIFQVSNCPQHELQDQIKFPRISQLEYLRGHQNSHLLRGRASTAQQGRGWLDLNMTFPKWWAPNLVRVPPEVWN